LLLPHWHRHLPRRRKLVGNKATLIITANSNGDNYVFLTNMP